MISSSPFLLSFLLFLLLSLSFSASPSSGQRVNIYFCNFFPVPGSIVVYNIPSTASRPTYNPPQTFLVPYGECEYIPEFAAPNQKFSIAARLEYPYLGTNRYFLTSTPFNINPITTDGMGDNDLGLQYMAYSVNQTTRDVTIAAANTAQNAEAENQNVFIASPLKSDPYDLSQGFQIQSIMPPFATRSQQMVSPLLDVPLSNTKLVKPIRLLLANFAPASSGNAGTFNVPTPYNGALDCIFVGGAAPNYYWRSNAETVQSSLVYSRNHPYYSIPNSATVDVVSSPPADLQSLAVGTTFIPNLGFGAFAPMIQLDIAASAFNDDPGFYLMLVVAGSGQAANTQIGRPWWIHSNYPPWSVNLHTVYGLGTQDFPFQTKVFTFSKVRQNQIKGFQSFMQNAITFAQKNGFSLNIFASTQYTQLIPFIKNSAMPNIQFAASFSVLAYSILIGIFVLFV